MHAQLFSFFHSCKLNLLFYIIKKALASLATHGCVMNVYIEINFFASDCLECIKCSVLCLNNSYNGKWECLGVDKLYTSTQCKWIYGIRMALNMRESAAQNMFLCHNNNYCVLPRWLWQIWLDFLLSPCVLLLTCMINIINESKLRLLDWMSVKQCCSGWNVMNAWICYGHISDNN